MTERRKKPRVQTPVEVLRRIRDGLERLQAEAEAAELDSAAEAIGGTLEEIEAEIQRRLV